jgi:hypothetical protein
MFIFAIGQRPLESVSKKIFLKIIPVAKFPIGSDARETKAKMMGERVFKILMNVFCVTVLYKILAGDDCDFLNVYAGGRIENPLFFYNHPCQKIPKNLDSFYIFKMSYHSYELIYTIIFDMKRTDFPEYMLHHFLTFILILFSYTLNYLPVGATVMILHDVTDLTTTIFKLFVDVTPMFLQILSYILMTTTWVYFRLWFLPMHIIFQVIDETNNWQGKTFNKDNFTLIGMLTTF